MNVIPKLFIVALLILGLVGSPISSVASSQFDIPGPPGSGRFGWRVYALPNGNFVVCDPYYDAGSKFDVGAVYLYDGTSGDQISMLIGSTADDQVCSNGVTVLANGNYVVASAFWDNVGEVDAGAVTWVNGATGLTGQVSDTNSLVGDISGNNVGGGVVVALSNGNYVVRSPGWDNGAETDAGAVTWGNGTTGATGVVSDINSLVGSTAYDYVGGLIPLSNGNYLVFSPSWDGSVVDVGAVTWGDGMTGITGKINAGNSLVGSTASDRVGANGVIELENSNYVVRSLDWDNGSAMNAGAITWGDGTTGVTGEVSLSNSLVGSSSYDDVGSGGVTALSNGNYVVSSPDWSSSTAAFAGAATWGDGTTGISGEISTTNSLVGSTMNDQVGYGEVTALTNGNYVVGSPHWNNGGAAYVGAATWGDGTTGISGTVSLSNSLVGSQNLDQVGSGVTALTNGNYVVSSSYWGNGTALNAGAVTWGDGTSGVTGDVSIANSLVGSSDQDRVGIYVTALSNGNYVVQSPNWDNDMESNAGAATWGDGLNGITGEVSAVNSLVGSTSDDRVSFNGVTALTNGNYVVNSSAWDNEGITNAGAVTWGDGTTGISGAVSPANSLVGSRSNDEIGNQDVTALTNGNYVVSSTYWQNDVPLDVGAVTWGDGANGITGEVSSANSLVGSTSGDRVGLSVIELPGGNYVVYSPYFDNSPAIDSGAITWGYGHVMNAGLFTADNSVRGEADGGGPELDLAYDDVNMQLIVGRPHENIVTLFRPNRLPVADAGADQTAKSGSSFELDGSVSYDPDENLPLTYDWEQSGGPPVTLNGSDTATPTFTAPVVMQPVDLTFTLVVTDALELPGFPDEVVITVEPHATLLPLVMK